MNFKYINLSLSLIVTIYIYGMEEDRLATPKYVGVAAIAIKGAEHIYKTWIPQINERNAQQIIEEINEHYKNLSPFVFDELKKKFVEKYATPLGSKIWRALYIDQTKENIVIYFDQRCSSLKRISTAAGSTAFRQTPQNQSPWLSYSFEELLKQYAKQKEIAQSFEELERTNVSLWPLHPEPTQKKDKRKTWHGSIDHLKDLIH